MRGLSLLVLVCVALLGLALWSPVTDACRVTHFGCAQPTPYQPGCYTRTCKRMWQADQPFPYPSCSAVGITPLKYMDCVNLNSAPEDCTVPCGSVAGGNGTIVTFNLESTFATFKVLINGYYLAGNGTWVKASCSSPGTCNATATNAWYSQSDVMSVSFGSKWPQSWPNSSTTYFATGLQRDGTETNPPYYYQAGPSYGCTNGTSGYYVPVSKIAGDWPPIYQVLYNNAHAAWNCSNIGTNWVVVRASYNGNSVNNAFAYTRNCTATPTVTVLGDPQFAGLRGQDYQVHGVDGGIYNIVSDKYMQLNSKFVFLTGPRPCPMIPTTGRKSVACFAHDGSYLGNLALRTNAGARVLIESGPAETGMTVEVKRPTADCG